MVAAADARMRKQRQAVARVTISPPTEPLYDPALFESRLAKSPDTETREPVPPRPTEPTGLTAETVEAGITPGPVAVVPAQPGLSVTPAAGHR